jgi:hypothetical protein
MGKPGTTVGGGGLAVLEDPTGRRARWMRRAGRLVFVVFLGWLLAIVLGGLGLMPVAGIPFTHVLRPSSGPPPLVKLPPPRLPSASDLRPALPAAAFAARAGKPGRQAPPAGSRGRSTLAPGQTKTTPAGGVTRGRSTTAPGQTKTTPGGGVTHGRSTTAPGQTKTSPSQGRSTTAPGQTKTSPSQGRSTTAPGQTKTTTTTSSP